MSGTAVGVSREHITKTPEICGGRACIAGTRIRVTDVVTVYEKGGLTADEIAGYFEGVTLADVHAALAYYFDHRDEIAEEYRQSRAVAAAARPQFPTLREKRGG